MKINFSSNHPTHDCIYTVLCDKESVYSSEARSSLIADMKSFKFEAKEGQTLNFLKPEGVTLTLNLLGLGDIKKLNSMACERIGAKWLASILSTKLDAACIDLRGTSSIGKMSSVDIAAYLASGIELRGWNFDPYKTVKKKPRSLKEITILIDHPEEAERIFSTLSAVNKGSELSREVISLPPNILYPATMVEKAKELSKLGIKVSILDKSKMTKLGMEALLGVAQGSEKDPYMIILEWNGGKKGEAPLAVVGKGVTFDTGGISLKPSNGMEEMKYDMGGSGVVIGLMKALALRKAKANVVGVMGMVENMPSGTAQRPSDVVGSMSGQTIEVLNTDAEGRLVLADALWYAQDTFKPSHMIDLATLTGAIVVALGHEYAGLFSNNDDFVEKIAKAGDETEEKAWRLPMGSAYDKDIDSDIADMKNIGSGRGAGSTTAAQFLERFVNDVPWCHIDIAGVTWDKKGRTRTAKGATGFGVRMLSKLIEDNFES